MADFDEKWPEPSEDEKHLQNKRDRKNFQKHILLAEDIGPEREARAIGRLTKALFRGIKKRRCKKCGKPEFQLFYFCGLWSEEGIAPEGMEGKIPKDQLTYLVGYLGPFGIVVSPTLKAYKPDMHSSRIPDYKLQIFLRKSWSDWAFPLWQKFDLEREEWLRQKREKEAEEKNTENNS